MALAAAVIFPVPLFAADVNFALVPGSSDSTVSRGSDSRNSSVIEVRLDPKSKNINVVEGAISVGFPESSGFDIDIENGNSILTLWPIAPKYNPEKGQIAFTGGVPLGTKAEGLLFRVRVTAPAHSETGKKSDEKGLGGITFAWAGGTAYLNDGKGTKEPISSKPLTVSMSDVSGIAEMQDAERRDEESAKKDVDSPGSNGSNNATIFLSSIISLLVLFYAYKKIVKKKAAL